MSSMENQFWNRQDESACSSFAGGKKSFWDFSIRRHHDDLELKKKSHKMCLLKKYEVPMLPLKVVNSVQFKWCVEREIGSGHSLCTEQRQWANTRLVFHWGKDQVHWINVKCTEIIPFKCEYTYSVQSMCHNCTAHWICIHTCSNIYTHSELSSKSR